METTLELLQARYGAVMTLEQLAQTLSRKPEGLRMALLSSNEAWAVSLNASKRYIGRRMYFSTELVAELLSGRRISGETE
ncbi:hypothetical protein SAMN05443245_0462 [Paraburkholderia fungorum]|uniref:Plasmid-related protein n=1 Tax=Paraburkholderia fungorum TaxID=134537 RepID=A0A1H0Z6B6_9BURK|nr:hypothetical protein SAMN05443245_0462 [Paraburkholderia fungorum]